MLIKPLDVYSALFPVHFICKFLGLAPNRTNENEHGFKYFYSSGTDILYNCCIVFLTLTSTVSLHEYILSTLPYEKTTVSSINNVLCFYSLVAIALSSSTLSLIRREKYNAFLNDICYTNVLMSNLAIKFCYRNVYLYSIVLIFQLILEFICMWSIYFFTDGFRNCHALKYALLFVVPDIIASAMLGMFQVLVILLKANIESLNYYLESLMSDKKHVCNSRTECRKWQATVGVFSTFQYKLMENARALNEMFSLQILFRILFYAASAITNFYCIVYTSFISKDIKFNLLWGFAILWITWDNMKVFTCVMVCKNFSKQVLYKSFHVFCFISFLYDIDFTGSVTQKATFSSNVQSRDLLSIKFTWILKFIRVYKVIEKKVIQLLRLNNPFMIHKIFKI